MSSSRDNSRTLRATIEAVFGALGNQRAIVDVMVNGNAAVAGELAASLAANPRSVPHAAIRIWHVALRDKANTWNQYVHNVWPGADTTFFVDGYASVMRDAFSQLSASLESAPEALAAAALPSVGRTAPRLRRQMLAAPQINGSLYALRGDAIDRLRDSAIRMPLGLYRIDSLIGGALTVNLSPATHAWDDRRIAVTSGATWQRPVESLRRSADRRAILRRAIRQAFGRFEERAIGEHLVQLRTSPAQFPATTTTLVWDWIRRHPGTAAVTLLRRPLALVGGVQVRRRDDWHLHATPPVRLFPA